tara:strand:- start:2309 stop:3265 length:957 start_codon:yes stop_codon:yes gene_type:complete
MSTAQTWIDQTRNMLLSGYVEELLTLSSPNASTTAANFTITGAGSSGIVPGVVIEIGSELCYVKDVQNSLVTTMRGYAGSTATAHLVDTLVRVSPKFPEHRIIESLNNDLADLSAPDNGIFQMKYTSFEYQAAVDGYNLKDANGNNLTSADVISIYSVSYADIGVTAMEPDVQSWRLKRNRNTSTFASGLALILYSGAQPGRNITVNYKSPLTAVTDSSTLLTATGLDPTAYDLPPLGAALALMSTTPIRREFLDAQGSSRRAEEVPPGAISASMRDLRSRRIQRIESEASRIASQYPQLWGRNSALANNYWYAGINR